MFNKKLKQELKETRDLVQLLNYEVRQLLYEREQAKNPNKRLMTPYFPSIITEVGAHEVFGISLPDLDKLKRKYRGSYAANY